MQYRALLCAVVVARAVARRLGVAMLAHVGVTMVGMGDSGIDSRRRPRPRRRGRNDSRRRRRSGGGDAMLLLLLLLVVVGLGVVCLLARGDTVGLPVGAWMVLSGNALLRVNT